MKKLSSYINESTINEEWRDEWNEIYSVLFVDIDDADELRYMCDDEEELIAFCSQREKDFDPVLYKPFLNAVKRGDEEVMSILQDIIHDRIDEIETGI